MDRVQQAISIVLDAIHNGTFTTEQALPPEAELAAFLGVSRTTMREAVKVLASGGVLDVVHGRGTFVLPLSEWTDLSTIAAAQSLQVSPQTLGLQLVEIRRMIEVGACGLAAGNRTEIHLGRMRKYLDDFDRANAAGDVEAVVEADMAFHDEVLVASGNPFLGAVLQPIKNELTASRTATSSDARIRDRAQQHHRAILAALEAGDVKGAKEAMRAHMTQTRKDIEAFLDA